MIGINATNGKDLYAKDNPPQLYQHAHPDHLRLQTRTYMATEHDPPPIRNKAGERCCLTSVDRTL